MVGVTRTAAGPHSGRCIAGLLILALLALIVVETPTASLRILWRFAVLSFDHPSTQMLDEVACESSTADGSGTGPRRFTHGVASGRFMPPPDPTRLVSFTLFSGITRSPPAV